MEANAVRFHRCNLVICRESSQSQQNPHQRCHRDGYNKSRWHHIDQQFNEIVGTDFFPYEEFGQPEDFVKEQDRSETEQRQKEGREKFLEGISG